MVPTGKDILVAVRRWIKHPDQYKAAAMAAKGMAAPDASDQIAKTIFRFKL